LSDIEVRAARQRRKAGVTLAAGLIVLLAIAVIGVFLVLRFVESQRQQDLLAWQTRLSIVADSRKADIEGWITRQLDDISSLANNASLQLYMAQLLMGGTQDGGDSGNSGADNSGETPFEADYLTNLLTVSAERDGFAAPKPTEVNANVALPAVAGLALVDKDAKVLVSTPGMPPIEGALRDFVQNLKPGTRGVLDLFIDSTGEPAMAFAAPVYGVQADTTSQPLGLVVGVKQVAKELFPLLRQPGETLKTARAVLVRKVDEGTIEYISPLEDGTPPLGLRLNKNTPELDASMAVAVASGFAIRRNHAGTEVLAATRGAFRDVPWALIYEVNRKEALADSDARASRLLTMLLLAVGLVAAALLAAWWMLSSRRAAETAERHRATAERLESQRRLLRLVTDSQPTEIAIFDTDNKYRFANKAAASRAGLAPEDLVGKPLENVIGPAAAEPIEALNKKALQDNQQVEETRKLPTGRVLHAIHVPVPASAGEPPGVLVTHEDLTDAFRERERRERLQDQLVGALVGVVDRRDPFSAEHSTRVGKLAREIATEMGLTPVQIATAQTAGQLMNLGKILIDPALLTKGANLSEDERQQIRRAMLASGDLLQGVEFDGPVSETLRQSLTRWDGSGVPAGLKGEDILPTARVVAVANAFVGMLSARAHRSALSVEEATNAIMRDVGKAYDRRAVAALVNYMDNRGGRAEWEQRTSAV
jgi:PAS domain S-box-containing protein